MNKVQRVDYLAKKYYGLEARFHNLKSPTFYATVDVKILDVLGETILDIKKNLDAGLPIFFTHQDLDYLEGYLNIIDGDFPYYEEE